MPEGQVGGCVDSIINMRVCQSCESSRHSRMCNEDCILINTLHVCKQIQKEGLKTKALLVLHLQFTNIVWSDWHFCRGLQNEQTYPHLKENLHWEYQDFEKSNTDTCIISAKVSTEGKFVKVASN
jgi:hypothetical protein